MINREQFIATTKYQGLSKGVQKAILTLDKILEEKGYTYEGIWRGDTPIAGKFEVPCSRRVAERKNLVTLRPKSEKLVVEVYWGQNNKMYFDVVEDSTQEELANLLEEVHKLANKYFSFN